MLTQPRVHVSRRIFTRKVVILEPGRMIMYFESFLGTLYAALGGLSGRLSQCQTVGVSSITPMRGTTKWEFCKKQNAECSGFSHSQDAESASQPFDRSGTMVGPKEMSNDSLYDRCRSGKDKEDDALCVQQGHGTCYGR